MMKKLVTLSAIIALMIAMMAPIAGAKPGGNGNGEAHGLDRQEVCHKGKKTLSLPAPAISAHLNHGDTEGACGEERPPGGELPGACESDPLAGAVVRREDPQNGGNDPVTIGDFLLIEIAPNVELAESGTVSVTVRDEDGTEVTFFDGPLSSFHITNRVLQISVLAQPPAELDPDANGNLIGVSSEGLVCT